MNNRSLKKSRFILVLFALAMLASCMEESYVGLGGGYQLDSDGGYSMELLNAQNDIIVASHILNYAFDSTFIVASQRPWDFPSARRVEGMSYVERIRAFEGSSFRQYWIVDKRIKSECRYDSISRRIRYANVYGPFNKQEYLRERDELMIPIDLQLKE